LTREFGEMRARSQRTLAISAGAHVLFLVWLLVSRQLAPPLDPIVEITWLETPPAVRVELSSPAPEKLPARQLRPAVEAPLSVREKLARNGKPADDVRRKLEALAPAPAAERALLAQPAPTASLTAMAQATMAPVNRSGPVANLNRGTGPREPAVALTRGPAAAHGVPAANVIESPGRRELPPPARPAAGSLAERNLGGATLAGLVADRRVLVHTMPTYPAWATTQAVEATVTLYFLVLPSGEVKQSVQVQRTAGFGDFDDNAVAAIRQWRFEPLTGSEAREQWGTITFRYRLHD
jgi:TonB family protein